MVKNEDKKIGLYIRVSSDKQLEEGFSFQAQEEKLIEEATREKRDYILYKDGGITGKNMDHREGLKQLMKDVELGIIGKVYVTKISRLARNSRDLENIIYEFEKNNADFKAISDGIDTSTPIGNVMVKLLGIFAEMERDIIIEQTRAGAEKRAKEGKMYGSGPIFGYDRVSDGRTMKIIFNEKEKPIIERIFNMYLGGYGYKAIVNRLNSEGHRTKHKNLFSINTIKTILENPLYAGYIRYGKYKDWNKKRRKGLSEKFILVKGNHDSIVSYEDWEAVQYRMKSNQRRKPPTGKYLLAGVLVCPECGSKMVGSKAVYKTKQGKVERLYYTCSKFHNMGTTACRSNGIRADLIDPIAIKMISQVVKSDELVDILYEYISHNYPNQNSQEGRKRLIELEISSMKDRKYGLRSLFTDGLISASEFKEDVQKINKKLDEFESILKTVDIDESESINTIEIISKEEIKEFLNTFSMVMNSESESDRLKIKELIKMIVEEIHVENKSKQGINISMNYREFAYNILGKHALSSSQTD